MPDLIIRRYENLTLYEFLIEHGVKPLPDRKSAIVVNHDSRVVYPAAAYIINNRPDNYFFPEGNPIFKINVIDIPGKNSHFLEFFPQRRSEDREGEWLSIVIQDSLPFGVFSLNEDDLESFVKAYPTEYRIDPEKFRQSIGNLDSLRYTSPGTLFGLCLELRHGKIEKPLNPQS